MPITCRARPVVVLVADPSLARGQVEVDVGRRPGRCPHGRAAAREPVPRRDGPRTGRGRCRPGRTAAPQWRTAFSSATSPSLRIAHGRASRGAISDPALAVFAEPAHEGIRATGRRRWSSAARRRPRHARAAAGLRRPTARSARSRSTARRSTLGRSPDNRPRSRRCAGVPRQHGRLQARRGTLVYTDLGSTNGIRVNGIRVDEIALGLGDRVQVGDTVLVVETAARLNGGRLRPDAVARQAPVPASLSTVPVRGRRASCCATCAPRARVRPSWAGSWSWPRRTASRRRATSFPLDAVTTLGRDVNNAIVIDDPFASARARRADVPRPRLVRGGPREHERHLRQRRARRARRAARVRRRAPGGRGPLPPRPGSGMSAVAAGPTERRGRGGSGPGRGRPSSRCSASSPWRCSSAAASLGATQRFRAVAHAGRRRSGLDFARPTRGRSLVYLAALVAVHVAFVLAGRRTDQVLLPATADARRDRPAADAAAAAGARHPVVLRHGALLGQLQLFWLLLALTVVAVLALVVRSDAWLRTYKYTWAAAGIALLLATFVFGSDVNGARLTLSIGPLSGQPSELLKVILVVFLAGYLSENRSLLADESHAHRADQTCRRCRTSRRWSRWSRSRCRSSSSSATSARPSCSSRCSSRCCTWRPAGRRTSSAGLLLFLVGSCVLYNLFGHVQVSGSTTGSTRSRDPLGAGYQTVQALYAFARGGLLGVGLGAGLPTIGGRLPIPAVHTDYPARGPRRGAGAHRAARDPRPVPRRHPARAADRRRRARRLPGAARRRPRARRRRPGVHHRGRQPQAHPADRDHAAVHLVRRLVAARERGRRRAAARPLRPRARAAAAAGRRAGPAAPRSCDVRSGTARPPREPRRRRG